MNNSVARTYIGKVFQELFVIWLLHWSVTIILRMLIKLITLQQDDIRLWTPLWYFYVTWAMYILGLFSSWGTSWIFPAWSPPEHQLTQALSPLWGPHPKPRCPEEVVYIPNDSCSHFTQLVFPPKLPWRHTCTAPHYTFNLIHTYYTSHLDKQLPFFYYMTNSLFYFFGSS
jgi:hypothetical protein